MSLLGWLAFAARWSGTRVLCPAVTSLGIYWFCWSGSTWVRLGGRYDV